MVLILGLSLILGRPMTSPHFCQPYSSRYSLPVFTEVPNEYLLQNVKLKTLRKHLKFFIKLDQHQFERKAPEDEGCINWLGTRRRMINGGVGQRGSNGSTRNARLSKSCTPQLWRRKILGGRSRNYRSSSSSEEGEFSVLRV